MSIGTFLVHQATNLITGLVLRRSSSFQYACDGWRWVMVSVSFCEQLEGYQLHMPVHGSTQIAFQLILILIILQNCNINNTCYIFLCGLMNRNWVYVQHGNSNLSQMGSLCLNVLPVCKHCHFLVPNQEGLYQKLLIVLTQCMYYVYIYLIVFNHLHIMI